MKNNLLTSLPADLLKGLHSLKYIYFEKNKLTSLPEAFFSDNRKLSSIDLSNNHLAIIPSNVFDGLKLSWFNLLYNVCVDFRAWDSPDQLAKLLALVKQNCVAPKAAN